MDVDSIEALIAEMEKRRPLWDTKVSGYHNRQVVTDEWNKVTENTGLTKEAAKNKWKNLRDTYKKELKKRANGDYQDEPSQYNGSWPHFASMSFVKSAFRQRTKKIDAQDISCQNQDSLESANYDEHDFTPVVSHIEILDESASDVECNSEDRETKSFRQSDIDGIVGEHPEQCCIARKRKKRNRHFEQLLELEHKKVALLTPVPDDEDLLFFKSLIPHVKRLKVLRKLHFRSRVLHVLTEELHKDSDADNPTVASSSSITKL